MKIDPSIVFVLGLLKNHDEPADAESLMAPEGDFAHKTDRAFASRALKAAWNLGLVAKDKDDRYTLTATGATIADGVSGLFDAGGTEPGS